MAKAKKAKSVAKPKKKGRQPDKAVASDTPRSHSAKCDLKSAAVAHEKAADAPSPQEDADCKIERVRCIWDALSEDDKATLLNVPIQELVHHAAGSGSADADRVGKGSMSDVLVSALERKQEMSTWRIWIWPHGNEVFPCAESLTKFLRASVLSPSFQELLPPECLSNVESEEQEALRLRMRALLDDVQKCMREHAEKMNDGAVKATSVRKMRRARLTTDEIVSQTKDKQIDMIIKMAGELSEEDEYLYQLVAFPINQFLNTTLPDSLRQTRYQMPSRPVTAAEVHFDELNSLSPDSVRTVFHWVHEKVASFATALKRPPGDADGGMTQWSPDTADVFVLSEDGESICISQQWKEFLKHQACVSVAESTENSADDLLLQWIYGNVVSEHEKARDGARRALYQGHVPDGQSVYSLLRAALSRQERLHSAYDSGMELLRCILKHRAKVEELVKAYPAMLERAYNKTDSAEERGRACFHEDEFPTKAVVAQLEREQSLTLAKLHILKHRHDQGVATVQKLRQEQRRGEPLFERMRKKFEDAKQAQKGVESCRSTSDADRHRQAAADIAMEEQMQAQYNVRAQGTYLQGLSNRISECEQENTKQTTEMKQLSQWKHTIARTLGALKEYQDMMHHGLCSASRQDHVLMAISGSSQAIAGPGPGQERQNFFETLRRQLYNDQDDHKFYSEVQRSLKELKEKMKDGRAAICHLHQNLISSTCDDPSSAIGMLLVLPFIQQRLDGMLEEHAASQAKQAEAELLLDTEAPTNAAVPAKTAKKKKKPKPKTTSTKQFDVDASAKAASEAARVKAEEQQRIRLEALERQRQLEDELLEKRKQELMQEEHGFWRQRMEQDKREKELMNTTQTSDCHAVHPDVESACSPRIGTSNHRQSSLQSASTAGNEARQHGGVDPFFHTSANSHIAQSASHSRKGSATFPQHMAPSHCTTGRSQGSADALTSSRRPVPPSVRQAGTRHGTQSGNAQVGAVPVRRFDDSQQATSLSHSSQAGQAGHLTSVRERPSGAADAGLQESAATRQAGPGSRAALRPAGTNVQNISNQGGNKQGATAGRQEFIATGEVVGVPVHTRAEYPVTVAATSRTSSADLHTIPKVEHVSHVKLSTSRNGNGRSTGATSMGTRPTGQPPTQVQLLHQQPAQPLAQPQAKTKSATQPMPDASVTAPQRAEGNAHAMEHPPPRPAQEAVPSASSPPAQAHRHTIQTSHAQQMSQPVRPVAHGHHKSAAVPAPPSGPHLGMQGAATTSGSRSNDTGASSGGNISGSSQAHTVPAQGTPVQPLAGQAPYMPLPCTHGTRASGYPPQHGVQTAVYYAPVSMGVPSGGQQPFYVQHMDGMYMQTHPAHAYGMVYQPAPYQTVMHPVPHFPPGAVPHPQFQAMQWTPAKQLNAQAPAFVPGHVHADAVPGQHHPQMRPPPAGMYHMHPTHVQQHVAGQAQLPSTDAVQPGGAPDSSRHSPATGPPGSDAVLGSADDRSVAHPDAESAATDSNSSSSTITAEPCCDAVHICCVSKADDKPVQPPADSAANSVAHARTPLASIRTETSNTLREPNALTAKSPRSPSSSKKRAAKKARKTLDSSKSLAALENQHEARYKLVGGRVGLRNRFGQNHCFLNVIVQALWHLKSFSKELMLLDVPELPGRSSCHSEWRLLSALASLFHEFEASNVTEDSSPTLSPDGLRSALPSAFANEGDMHDAHEVLHEMFSALHFAQAGGGPASIDPTLPLLSFVPEAHVSRPPVAATSVAETTWARRVGAEDKDAPSSLVIHTFGMRVQVPNPQESPLPGRIAVDRFVRYFHHVNTEPLIMSHQEAAARGDSFHWSQAVQRSGFDAGADVPLLSHPSVVTLTIVWHTARPNRRHIQDVCDTMQTAETLDISQLFTGMKRPANHHLRCVITYQHLHYIAFVRDESQGWLMLNDSRITRFGEWGKALEFMVEDDLLPIVLFYEN